MSSPALEIKASNCGTSAQRSVCSHWCVWYWIMNIIQSQYITCLQHTKCIQTAFMDPWLFNFHAYQLFYFFYSLIFSLVPCGKLKQANRQFLSTMTFCLSYANQSLATIIFTAVPCSGTTLNTRYSHLPKSTIKKTSLSIYSRLLISESNLVMCLRYYWQVAMWMKALLFFVKDIRVIIMVVIIIIGPNLALRGMAVTQMQTSGEY